MKKIKCIQKLSKHLPEASLEMSKKKLAQLQLITTQSTEFSEEIGQIIAQLRSVAAPSSEPFIFTSELQENEQLLRVVFRDCSDIEFRIFDAAGKKALLVYLKGMADTSNLERNVLKPLMSYTAQETENTASLLHLLTDMKLVAENVLGAASVTILASAKAAIDAVMTGNALLMIDGLAEVASIAVIKYVKREISAPYNEYALQGSDEAFNEAIMDNIALIRRRTRDTNLKVHIMKIGERTNTAIAVLYVANLVKPGLVEEVERRIGLIKKDKLLDSASIDQYLVDHPWSPFPQTQMTERPDKMLAALYEGRVGIIVDGTPVEILVPCTYNVLMQAPDDYTMAPIIASLIRFSRNAAAFLAVYLPAIYVAVVSYHPGMLPTTMAISIAELRSRTPFPSFLEAIMMEILLELIQEAIIRLPAKLTGAASMIGAFIIGNTVVQAGLINPLLVVVIATTAISSYSMPSYNFSMALRWTRVPMLILASMLGLYGVILGVLAITIHLCSLRSFGESYLGGMFNVDLLADWKDSVVRLPAKLLTRRPKEFGAQDQIRIGDNDGQPRS
ncbi:spore germination protein [Pelosinus propionicus]|uniref:Spore germination protein n=1 Tax=Pelosinus propionicus DSM 13327 TaxID=1123291 RepID=A0A1I4NRP9_9FIRM|nr:spore germination protein [Pelosinus propionicus]SFM18050.1 spore germination protein [Pelosinus propionicus DSM 13327]